MSDFSAALFPVLESNLESNLTKALLTHAPAARGNGASQGGKAFSTVFPVLESKVESNLTEAQLTHAPSARGDGILRSGWRLLSTGLSLHSAA